MWDPAPSAPCHVGQPWADARGPQGPTEGGREQVSNCGGQRPLAVGCGRVAFSFCGRTRLRVLSPARDGKLPPVSLWFSPWGGEEGGQVGELGGGCWGVAWLPQERSRGACRSLAQW